MKGGTTMEENTANQNRKRYTRDHVVKNLFYQLPKFLFDREFTGLSNDARVLYSLLRNRHDLSIKNGWLDKNDHVYLIFTRKEMRAQLKLSDKPVKKAMDALKTHALLEEIKQGQGKPNRIYLLVASTPPDGDATDSGTGETPIQEPENSTNTDSRTEEIPTQESEKEPYLQLKEKDLNHPKMS
jgi:hypothetical protein